VSRRAKLPGAAELFRVTGQGSAGQAPRSEPEPAVRGFAEPVAAGGASGAATAVTAVPDHDRPASLAEAATAPRTVRSVPPLAADQLFDHEESLALPEPASLPQARRNRVAQRRPARPQAERRPSGRERHEEKITVYVSSEELLDLERARLTLRGEHGLAVDRGRIVREAVAVVLADLDEAAEESVLVRRLRDL